ASVLSPCSNVVGVNSLAISVPETDQTRAASALPFNMFFHIRTPSASSYEDSIHSRSAIGFWFWISLQKSGLPQRTEVGLSVPHSCLNVNSLDHKKFTYPL